MRRLDQCSTNHWNQKAAESRKFLFETLDSPSSLCKRMGDIAGSGDELEVPRRRNQ
jgi:hypothetical protein